MATAQQQEENGFGQKGGQGLAEGKRTRLPRRCVLAAPFERGRAELGNQLSADDFRLLNRASGPEVVYLCDLNGPIPPQNPLDKFGGKDPHLFQWFFFGRRGCLDPKNKRFPARRQY